MKRNHLIIAAVVIIVAYSFYWFTRVKPVNDALVMVPPTDTSLAGVMAYFGFDSGQATQWLKKMNLSVK